MMEAARTSETLVNYQTTRSYNPKDSHLRTHRRENLKSYSLKLLTIMALITTTCLCNFVQSARCYNAVVDDEFQLCVKPEVTDHIDLMYRAEKFCMQH
jgi:hypothetical protein